MELLKLYVSEKYVDDMLNLCLISDFEGCIFF